MGAFTLSRKEGTVNKQQPFQERQRVEAETENNVLGELLIFQDAFNDEEKLNCFE